MRAGGKGRAQAGQGAAAGGDEAARADEKRVLQARRAVEKAIRVLDGPGEQYD